jgi:hypothetical protein
VAAKADLAAQAQEVLLLVLWALAVLAAHHNLEPLNKVRPNRLKLNN